MTQQQSVLAWLKDAHAMEQGGTLTLENHAAAAQGYAEVQSKLRAHAEATRRHADLVEGCIERLGSRPSALKEAIGTVVGKVQGVANLPAKDTVVKNALGDLAAENFEIASYRSLIAAAEQAGDGGTANVCRQILKDEEEMANWLAAQIPVITQQFLDEQTGEESSGVQAQVMDKAKQTVKGLGEQGKGLAAKVKQLAKGLEEQGEELAEKAKQAGQDVQAQAVDKAKRLADELEEQGEELVEKAKRKGKDALVTSGALLVGAGVGLLALQALRSRSGEKRQTPDDDSDAVKDAYDDVRIDHDAAYSGAGVVGLSTEPVAGLDLRTETLDLSEAFVENVERPTVPEPQPEELLGDMSGRIAEPPVVPGFQSQQQTLNNPLSLDADVIGTDLIGGDVQVVDGSPSSDTDLIAAIDAELMSDDAPSEDVMSSLDTELADAELADSDAHELSSLDADSREAELMSSDAQSDVRDVSEVAHPEVWQVPGPYSGLGPIGYDSTGDPIREEVYSRLTQHGHVDATGIEITIDNGEVLLEGTVDSEATKRLAEEAVETVTGVSRVQNLLRVQASQGQDS